MAAPLTGFTVGITGDRRSDEQAELLRRRGARIVHGPVMRTGLLDDADATRRATEEALAGPVDVVVLSTGIGTRSWFAVAESAGLDGRLRAACAPATVVARGPKARGAAGANGLSVHWEAPGETGAEVVRYLEQSGAAGRRIVVQRDGGAPLLADGIRTLGAEVIDVPVYRWESPDDPMPARRLLESTAAGRVHAITFTSSYAVGSAFDLAPHPDALRAALAGPVVATSVGPVTTATLRRHGVDRVVEPARARLGAMVQALVAEMVSAHRLLRLGGHEVRWQGDALLLANGVATLTAGEARLLDVLVGRTPAVVPKADLVHGAAGAHAVEAAVGRLRTKLGPLGAGIRTVPRRGYASTLEIVTPN